MKYITFAVLLAFSSVVGATNPPPSAGTNTNTNTNTNNVHGGAGGQGGKGGEGGKGGTSYATGGTGIGVGIGVGKGGKGGEASAEQFQEQGQFQAQSTTSAAQAVVDNGGNTQALVVNEVKQHRTSPNVAISATTTTANCKVAVTGGFSGFGVAVGAGGAVTDDTCELIELSKQFMHLGLLDQSVQIMCLNEKAKKVMGLLCIE